MNLATSFSQDATNYRITDANKSSSESIRIHDTQIGLFIACTPPTPDSRTDLHPSRKMVSHRRRPDCTLAPIMVTIFVTLALVDAQITEYLDPHNAARAAVGSPPLTWSARLADYARSYATTQHTHCLPLTHSHGEYGENLFWGSAGGAWTPLDAITAWINEAPDYSYSTNACEPGKMCGHYTQVVWTSTTHLGCASIPCSDGAAYFICSYDPPGNWIGERPFNI